jgi:hypothetical protein
MSDEQTPRPTYQEFSRQHHEVPSRQVYGDDRPSAVELQAGALLRIAEVLEGLQQFSKLFESADSQPGVKTVSEIKARIEALRKEGEEYADKRSEMGWNPDNEEEHESLNISMAQVQYAIWQLEWVVGEEGGQADG